MSAPTRVLVVFARTPRYGTVKSRLARQVGTNAAWQVYQAMLRRLLRTASAQPFWRIELAVTPMSNVVAPAWRRLPVTPQVRGDLGRRMAASINSHVARAPVAVVGTDVPGITREHLRQAFALLDSNDLVFGPAEDGGYWLVGARRGLPALTINRLFAGVRWSTDKALSDTLVNVRSGLRVAFAATLRDVDTVSDLAAWRDRLSGYGPSGR